jgi:hypothetical protein
MLLMWRNVPRKNISSRIADVFRPRRKTVQQFVGAADRTAEERDLSPDAHGDFPGHSLPIGKFILVFVIVAAIGIVTFGVFAYERKMGQLTQVAESLGEAQNILPGLRGYDELFKDEGDGVPAEQANPFAGFSDGAISLSDMLGGVQALFTDVGSTFTSAQDVTGRLGTLIGHANRLDQEGVRMMLTGRGEELLALMRETRDDLKDIDSALQNLSKTPGTLKTFMPLEPAEYLDYRIMVNRAKTVFDAAIAWLSEDKRHVAVFFLNPAELRPGGGFIGSYADLTLDHGSLVSMTVHDVNEPDRELAASIVPPRELQGLVKRWRAADANWFFDFPASAEKVLSFMDASKLYSAESPYFDAAFGVSAPVIRDILAKVGPLKLASGDTITAESFLMDIQRQVQLAQERGDDSPKLILGELAPLIMSAMSSDGFSWDNRMETVASWVTHKDLMVYFREPTLQSFAETIGAAGSVFRASADRDVDYLAVVIANIGGGKSDLYTTQDIMLQSQLGADGTVSDHLIVKRTHNGTKAKEWWYRTTNQAFVKIFAPGGAKLGGTTGIAAKTVTPLMNYAKSGYAIDSDLARLEGTARDIVALPGVTQYEESDRTAFGAWMRTPLGETTEMTLDYTTRLFTEPKTGATHTLILERQTGATGTYRVELHAPVGFRWRENGLPVYEYETTDLPGRLVITLTLEQAL